MILANKSVQPWHDNQLDGECIRCYADSVSDRLSSQHPLRYKMSRVYYFQGKQMLVLMMMSIAGNGTTGMAMLTKSELIKRYPTITVLTLSQDDVRDPIIKEFKSKYPNASEDEMYECTREDVVKAY